MSRKTYNASDLQRQLKLSREVVQRYLREMKAPKDELGYYVWSKPIYDKIIKSIPNVRSTSATR